jgi:hypothetical protein
LTKAPTSLLECAVYIPAGKKLIHAMSLDIDRPISRAVAVGCAISATRNYFELHMSRTLKVPLCKDQSRIHCLTGDIRVQYAQARWENCAMPKRSSIGKRRSKALSALGFAGMSLSMASGACASTSEASANTSPPPQKHELFLGEEEISDVSLATFYVFDKENAGPPPLFQKRRLTLGGCGGCGCGGCARCAYSPQPPQPPKATRPTQHRKK